MNNTPDYNDNLAFEPEFTWEDLVEWAKEFCKKHHLSYELDYCDTLLAIDLVSVQKDGYVSCNGCYHSLAENRTPRQMQTIIKALYE